jgi:hypothetical protein
VGVKAVALFKALVRLSCASFCLSFAYLCELLGGREQDLAQRLALGRTF